MKVAIVLVSHSRQIASGLAELAGQMAPDVTLLPTGGLLDGELGSGLDDVRDALRTAAWSDGVARDVVVLADLGSSVMNVESALELDADLAARVVLAPGPFVEGAVAAAVAAHGGSGVDDVVAAVRQAGATFAAAGAAASGESSSDSDDMPALDGSVTTTATLRNPLGLHARPAALVSRKVAELGASVMIDGVDASSVLQLMALGAAQGQELTITVSGPGAQDAAATLAQMVGSGFGEV